MTVEVICIGDELLIGQTVNTNATWIGAELANFGVKVMFSSVIKDVKSDICNALDLALSRVDVVIVTGGLGPTKDDVTKSVLAEYFKVDLELNQDVLTRVKAYFLKRGKKMVDVNVRQAELPKGCTILQNDMGTAPGMWFDVNDQVVVSLPGVPFEMKYILKEHGFPLLLDRFNSKPLFQRTLQFQGIGESYLADRISDLEEQMFSDGLSFAYLPSAGAVRLRISGKCNAVDEELITNYIIELYKRFPAYAFGEEEESLSEIVGTLLVEDGLSLGTVESCTGGAIASELVRVPGSSRYFRGSVISYANEVKVDFVGVNHSDIERDGAVSEVVVKQMAENGRRHLGVDYCISTSGITGPEGGSEEKPVGLVWIGIAGPEGVVAKHFLFGDFRERNIRKTVLSALNLLRCELLEINTEKK
ncbi:MAG: competence/damage-inducible protein A [Crocinitomicaceae bacterium]|nr:competence/damage-inducible protein A [Crocinitomicaceae bacterium]MDG1777480.1 competence/damage-inducible protein A [Crocinitomicaceae bacterium]